MGRGYTLIEIVVVLAILAVLVAFLAPMAFESVQSSKIDATRSDVQKVFQAIVGEPDKGNFGYLGDMGRLPASVTASECGSLGKKLGDELVTQGSQTAFHTDDSGTPHVGNVGTGWRGPYLTGPFSTGDLLKDSWGQPYCYTETGSGAGQIVSKGPDGTFGTGDDIKFPVDVPSFNDLTKGTLVVTVIVNDIPQAAGITVQVYSASNGEQSLLATKTTDADGRVPFRFDVPHGISAVKVTHTSGATTVTRTITVAVAAATQVSRQIIMKTSASVAM